MAKYVITKDAEGFYFANTKIEFLWLSSLSYIPGTASRSEEECINKLKKITTKEVVVKELDL